MEPVRILLVEDSDDDAVLVVRRLRKAGLNVDYRRVETAEGMSEHLRGWPPDIVISDNSMPRFSAKEALDLVRHSGLDVPFLVVSGEIGEEAAAALMRAGAHDFVLKSSLTRLPPAVHRELREAEERRHRRQVQAALQNTEERFRLVAENLRDVVFKYSLEPERTLEYISPSVADLTGHQPLTLYTDPDLIFAAVDSHDRAELRRSWHAPPTQPLTTRWHKPDGSLAWIEQRLVAVHDPSGRTVGVEGILRDVTDAVTAAQEREELARQLHQAERLDSLGQLAGGVAHDFNNLLSVISSYTAFVLEELPPDHPSRSDAENVAAAARQAAALTRQLLIFSRLEPAHPETIDVNAVVTDIQRLLHRTIGEDIEFVIRTDPRIDSVVMDRSRLEQIIMNLVVNARAAMPDGGRLTIVTHTRRVPDDRPDANSDAGCDSDEPVRPEVSITVTDTGCGMDAETRRRAFEPFFTTKGRGKGSGLGLATVYGAVTDAGGTIDLWSQPGEGTRFTICLPSSGHLAADMRAPDPAVVSAGSGQRVLLVEDEPAVRDVTERILTRGGYTVTTAVTRDDAMRIIGDADQPFDIVLSDVVMPGMTAARFVDTLRTVHPALPIVLMSGYTGEGRGTGDLPRDLPLVSKPFDQATLLREIRRALEARS